MSNLINNHNNKKKTIFNCKLYFSWVSPSFFLVGPSSFSCFNRWIKMIVYYKFYIPNHENDGHGRDDDHEEDDGNDDNDWDHDLMFAVSHSSCSNLLCWHYNLLFMEWFFFDFYWLKLSFPIHFWSKVWKANFWVSVRPHQRIFSIMCSI